MHRTIAWAALFSLAAAALGVAWLGRSASAEDRVPRIVYVHISGSGPQAKAWVSGGPPAGESVQDVLDRFSAEGYRYLDIASSGSPGAAAGTGSSLGSENRSSAEYVVLLERR